MHTAAACRSVAAGRTRINDAHVQRPIRITGVSRLDHSQGRVTTHHKMHQGALPAQSRQAHNHQVLQTLEASTLHCDQDYVRTCYKVHREAHLVNVAGAAHPAVEAGAVRLGEGGDGDEDEVTRSKGKAENRPS